ncbi:hypothetical protein DUNSADRAFT_10430 [Dunaliella salina]|uniref:Uncharacterized protein n=1 Tax=Dunaliella salina TaxID=3046 RepID=A0ABQ7GFD6_DUNSA|nr:hypothetical protein DUNSADRAFT_10430 [Dunaliella salina]|eukprot:KAF5833309.1 hypothetical protein DUNSADRAFT_10430 [Dunaliella salina]
MEIADGILSKFGPCPCRGNIESKTHLEPEVTTKCNTFCFNCTTLVQTNHLDCVISICCDYKEEGQGHCLRCKIEWHQFRHQPIQASTKWHQFCSVSNG